MNALKHILLHSKKFNKYQAVTRFAKSYGRAASNELVLGIETSCDDTGCAIVDDRGNILGEALNSQHLIHLK